MLTGKIFTIVEVAGTGNKTVIPEWWDFFIDL